MVHGVECCRKIKQNKNSYLSLVNCTENVIANLHQGSFCAVIGSVRRLERLHKVVFDQIVIELHCHSLFTDFRCKTKV